LISQWQRVFTNLDIQVDVIKPSVRRDRPVRTEEIEYRDGLAWRGPFSVRILTGPGIDIDTKAYVHYVALDYGRSFWASWRKEGLAEEFAEEIEKALLAQGARRIGIETKEVTS
jgi:hypothetical protein